MVYYCVKITEQAQEQLREIYSYIALQLQSPNTALKMLDVLEKEISSLSYFPNRIALTEEEPWHSKGIHKMPVKNYLVYFWIDDVRKTVQITAVVYGRSEQKTQLSQMSMDSMD